MTSNKAEQIKKSLIAEFRRQMEEDTYGRNYFSPQYDVDDGVMYTIDGHFNLEIVAEVISSLFGDERDFTQGFFDYKGRQNPRRTKD